MAACIAEDESVGAPCCGAIGEDFGGEEGAAVGEHAFVREEGKGGCCGDRGR